MLGNDHNIVAMRLEFEQDVFYEESSMDLVFKLAQIFDSDALNLGHIHADKCSLVAGLEEIDPMVKIVVEKEAHRASDWISSFMPLVSTVSRFRRFFESSRKRLILPLFVEYSIAVSSVILACSNARTIA